MILTNTPNTPKQRQEHRLLVSVRFACVMNQFHNPGSDPMNCARVKNRLAELQRYVLNSQPSKLFHDQYVDRAGELGGDYAIRVNGSTGIATVFSSLSNTNIVQLTA